MKQYAAKCSLCVLLPIFYIISVGFDCVWVKEKEKRNGSIVAMTLRPLNNLWFLMFFVVGRIIWWKMMGI